MVLNAIFLKEMYFWRKTAVMAVDHAQKIWSSPDAPQQIEALYLALWATIDEAVNVETLQNILN